jgi:hypothetical protein
LAGFAAETAYGLLNEFDSEDKVFNEFYNCLSDLSSSADFCKVADIVYNTIGEGHSEFDEKFKLLVGILWNSTLKIVEHNMVRDAIEKVADVLIEKMKLSNQQIITLLEEEVVFRSLENFLIPLPLMDL